MKKLTTLAITLALFGCNTPNHIEGQLTLKSALTVKNTDNKVVSLPKGTYNTSVAMNPDGGQVRIHNQGPELIFSVPKLVADAQGKINYSAAQLGQKFALQGEIYDAREDIDRTVSGSCVLGSHQDYQCTTQSDGTQSCDWVTVDDYGSQDIHETGYQDTKVVKLNIVQQTTLGAFTGSYAYSETIQSSQAVSDCR